MSEENKYNFHVCNISANDDFLPRFTESAGKKFWTWGIKNTYPDFLLELYNYGSAQHKAIINAKARMIGAQGFVEVLNPSLEYTKFINNISSNNQESLDEIAYNLAFDIVIYGGFALTVSWNSLDKIVLDYLPFDKVRVGVEENTYYVSKDWKNPRKVTNRPKMYKGFSILDKEKFPTQVYYYKQPGPGISTYPYVEYSAAIRWIDSDFEIARYHNVSIKNNFSGGYHIGFKEGKPTPDLEQKIYSKLEKQFTSTRKANKLVVTHTTSDGDIPTFTPLESNSSDVRYLVLAEQITQQIFTAHDVKSPELFANQKDSGSLGNKQELMDKMALFQSDYIAPKQKAIEKVLNRLAKINGVNEEIKLAKYDLFPEDETSNESSIGDGNSNGDVVQNQSNDNIKNMTGRQMEGMMRIIRKFDKGQITEIIAIDMLMKHLGISEADAKKYLAIEDEEKIIIDK